MNIWSNTTDLICATYSTWVLFPMWTSVTNCGCDSMASRATASSVVAFFVRFSSLAPPRFDWISESWPNPQTYFSHGTSQSAQRQRLPNITHLVPKSHEHNFPINEMPRRTAAKMHRATTEQFVLSFEKTSYDHLLLFYCPAL